MGAYSLPAEPESGRVWLAEQDRQPVQVARDVDGWWHIDGPCAVGYRWNQLLGLGTVSDEHPDMDKLHWPWRAIKDARGERIVDTQGCTIAKDSALPEQREAILSAMAVHVASLSAGTSDPAADTAVSIMDSQRHTYVDYLARIARKLGATVNTDGTGGPLDYTRERSSHEGMVRIGEAALAAIERRDAATPVLPVSVKAVLDAARSYAASWPVGVEPTPVATKALLLAIRAHDAAQPVAADPMHYGRASNGHDIEDDCPCPQEPCGLVDMAKADPDCDQHSDRARKTMRQGHVASACPARAGETPELPDPPAGLKLPLRVGDGMRANRVLDAQGDVLAVVEGDHTSIDGDDALAAWLVAVANAAGGR